MAHRTHDALVMVAPRAPYEICKFDTVAPKDDEVLINVKWTASTPLDLHQADGGLLVEHPSRSGSTSVGVVIEVGPDVKHLKVGDAVFGFAHQKPKWKAHQEFATAPEWVFGKIPEGFKLEEAATVPENFVTAFNTLWADLRLPTPWPKPANYQPPRADDRILIWGAASSVGQHIIQVLKFYGYRNLVATASPKHREYLTSLGATKCFDYRSHAIVDDLLNSCRDGSTSSYPLIVDCIGSQEGSLEPISKVARTGSTVAVMLPVILKHASNEEKPEYSMDASTSAQWAEGVIVRGVRTHFYWKNPLFKEKLQLDIMPTLLAEGAVKPNRYRIIEGQTLLERATKALDTLRNGVSGEKLVWRVSER
ncbi:Uu.00g000720.m01.CDS01 [Anthostomella pinea]|uniref:Uu.00g000720.m01.CDS01 n=1 Tax=Anthostomella pinea TaxID=933095 RepID=A0AAI8YIK7_9PEZI|nr:Uu.00g000720.m01.CDS01 [Anthostomella pinea]